jgi:hypothetical protein
LPRCQYRILASERMVFCGKSYRIYRVLQTAMAEKIWHAASDKEYCLKFAR